MKRGHPTKKDQVDLRKTLFEFWSKNRSVAYTAEQTKTNIKTVTAYFKEFAESITEDMNEDFIKRQKAVKQQALKAMDEMMVESETQLEEIKEKCADDPENTSWESIRASIIRDRMAFINEKANLEISPTLDVDLEELVEERLANSSTGTDKAKA